MSTRKLKILFLPRWYPHRYDPMPGLFIERHARSVAGYTDVAVLYVHQDDRLKDKKFDITISRDEELFQVKIYYRPVRIEIPVLSSFLNLLKFTYFHYKGLAIITKEFGRPDLLHVNVLTRLGALALLYQWLTGTPYVITEHWTRYLPHMDNFRGVLRKNVSRKVVRNAAAVLPVTDNLRSAMEGHRLYNNNYRIIPNVVDMKMFNIYNTSHKDEEKNFIHVSCFEDKQKNISGILRVLKRLSELRSDWTCQMVGDGIHFERLVAYASELGLDSQRVVFIGLKENEELAMLMAKSDFQVMFSRFENLPVVILESYACGVPVLSTDVGGIREHMNENLGILITSEDEDELLEKLIFMLDHYRDYNKTKLREYAILHFSKEVIGKQLYDVYREIIKN